MSGGHRITHRPFTASCGPLGGCSTVVKASSHSAAARSKLQLLGRGDDQPFVDAAKVGSCEVQLP